jgi:AcrR family transcriptional regulator
VKNTPTSKSPAPVPGAREKLLLTAAEFFAAKGYAATAVREIVGRVGVSKPVLYYHFGSKEGLFQAILDHAGDTQAQVLAEATTASGGLLERLVFFCRRIEAAAREHQALFVMIHNLFFGPSQGVPPCDLMGFHREMVAAIKAIYVQAQENDPALAADPQDVAYLVLSVIDFSLNMEQFQPGTSDPGRSERLLRLAFSGLDNVAEK